MVITVCCVQFLIKNYLNCFISIVLSCISLTHSSSLLHSIPRTYCTIYVAVFYFENIERKMRLCLTHMEKCLVRDAAMMHNKCFTFSFCITYSFSVMPTNVPLIFLKPIMFSHRLSIVDSTCESLRWYRTSMCCARKLGVVPTSGSPN